MNVTQNVEQAAKIFPDKPAIIFEDREITYGQLDDRASRLADTMQKKGVKKGDRVSLYLPNIPEFIVCYIASLKIGAIAVSVNPMLKSAELQYILNDSDTVLLCTAGELLSNVKREDYPDLKHVLVCEGDANGNPTIDEWIGEASKAITAADLDRDETAGRGEAFGLGNDGLRVLMAQKDERNSCHVRKRSPLFFKIVYIDTADRRLNKPDFFGFCKQKQSVCIEGAISGGIGSWGFPALG